MKLNEIHGLDDSDVIDYDSERRFDLAAKSADIIQHRIDAISDRQVAKYYKDIESAMAGEPESVDEGDVRNAKQQTINKLRRMGIDFDPTNGALFETDDRQFNNNEQIRYDAVVQRHIDNIRAWGYKLDDDAFTQGYAVIDDPRSSAI